MRFSLLTTFFPPYRFGGYAISVANLANLLASAGHNVEVVHSVDSFGFLVPFCIPHCRQLKDLRSQPVPVD